MKGVGRFLDRRSLVVSIAGLTALLPLRADDVPAPAPVTDPALVERHFRQVSARPEFFDAHNSGINPRLEDLFSEWFQRLGKRVGDFNYASHMPAFESLLMSVLVVLSVAVLIYIVFRLSRGRRWTWNEPSNPSRGQETPRSPEFYDEEISHAVKTRDWHGAWLATWRQFLSRLESRSLVESDRTRTNREYLRQLHEQPLPASALPLLTGMVDAYDRFIYGHVAIEEVDWNHFHQQIEEAALLLHLDDNRARAHAGGASS